MTFYLAMSRVTDLNKIAAEAERGERPRHALHQLAESIGAVVVAPDPGMANGLDRLRARIAGEPMHWALARSLARRLAPGDVVYCPDEGVGLPVAALCGPRRGPPRVMVFVHNVIRPRAKAALRFVVPARRTAFMAVSPRQTDFLADGLGVPADQLLTLSDQTDLRFFTPGPGTPQPRPLLMSIGLEQRDYTTLAQAAGDLDVNIRISGYSADAKAVAKAFPPIIPANMTRDFYSWPDLLDLYRSSNIVVVSLVPNTYAAGIQALNEAIACQRPVIVTRTEGLAPYLDRPDLVTTVPTGDPAALRSAILAKLADRGSAERQAKAAFDHYRARIDSDGHVAAIADRLRQMAAALR